MLRQVGKVLFTSKLPSIQKQIDTELLNRVKASAITVRNEWVKVLSGPRHGRYYRIPGTHRKRQKRAARFVRAQTPRGGFGEMEQGAASLLATKGIGGFYRASAPGEAPAVRLARFKQSLKFWAQLTATGATAHVGTSLEPYPVYLEKGTRKMAARPSLKPAMDNSKSEVVSILTRPLRLT